MKIIIKILPIEYFALYHYTHGIYRHTWHLAPENRYIGDVLLSEFFLELRKEEWKWKYIKKADKFSQLKLNYSTAKTLGMALMEMCPGVELQQVLDKLHKALVNKDGTLLDNLKLEATLN
jgi:hypothetical protein